MIFQGDIQMLSDILPDLLYATILDQDICRMAL
jgi:hypothetical protein